MKAMTFVLLVAATLFSSACTWVESHPGAEQVSVKTEAQLKHCRYLGTASAQTADSSSFYSRNEEKVAAEILTLARNEALRMKGNALLPKNQIKDGEQDFAVYLCPGE